MYQGNNPSSDFFWKWYKVFKPTHDIIREVQTYQTLITSLLEVLDEIIYIQPYKIKD